MAPQKEGKNFYLDFNKSTTDDYEIVKQMREVLMKADCVVGHNGDRYRSQKISELGSSITSYQQCLQ